MAEINNEQSLKAISALKIFNEKHHTNSMSQDKCKKMSLLEDTDPIFLNVSTVSCPKTAHIKPIRIPLPYFHIENPRVCLFSKDSRKAVKDLLATQHINTITEVISLQKLTTHFKTFEQKRKLCNMYDIFLADRYILHLLPNLLGKSFYERKKLPIRIDLKSTTLSSDIKKASQCVYLRFKKNSHNCVKIGSVDMTEDQLLHNLVHSVKVCVSHIPGGWKSIRSLHIKTNDSISIPLYMKDVDNV